MSIRVYYGVECDLCRSEALADVGAAELDLGYGEREALRDTGYALVKVQLDGEEWEVDLCPFCERLREAGEVTEGELRDLCRKEREKRRRETALAPCVALCDARRPGRGFDAVKASRRRRAARCVALRRGRERTAPR